MKKITLSIATILFIATSVTKTIAQKAISQGKVVYEITYPEMQADNQMAAMLPTESTFIFKDSRSRVETAMGMGMSTVAIYDAKSGDIITLMDMMGTKSAIKMTDAEIKEAKAKNTSPEVKYNIEETKETKVIAGYTCKKAIVKSSDGASTVEVYYTDKITSKAQSNDEWKNLKGFPMEYTMEQQNIKMKLVAKAVTGETVTDDSFKIPADYKIMTKEEMMKMFQGGDSDAGGQ